MGHLSSWLAAPILAFSVAAALAADARPQPSAEDLIDGILAEENNIESVQSIYLRFEGRTTRSPEAIARNLAALKKRWPDTKIDVEQNTDLWPEIIQELDVAFDRRRARKLDYAHHDYWILTTFDGQRAVHHGKGLRSASTHQEAFSLDAFPQQFFADPFVDFDWPRLGLHQLWFAKQWTPDQIKAQNRTFKTYRVAGEAEFHGHQCYLLDSMQSSRRLHVGIGDGRLYGSTRLNLPPGVDRLPVINRAAGRSFASDAEYRQWEKGLTAEESQKFFERCLLGLFPLLQPETASHLDNYREIAPGFWFPATQAYGWGFGESRRELRLVEFKVDEPLADSLFVIDLKDGVEVTDHNYDPPLHYEQKADRTPDQWQAIIGEHKKRTDQRQAEIAARDAWIGQPAPKLPVSAWVNSTPLSLESLKGKVVLLAFLSINCPSCRVDLSNVESLYKDANDAGIVVIDVHASGTGRDDVEALAKKLGLTYPIAIELPPPDGEVAFGALSGPLGVRSIPYSFVIDQEGKIAAHGRLGQSIETAYALARKSKE